MEPRPLELSTPLGPIAGLGFGAPGGQPAVALHGWLDNAASFVRLAPLLADRLQIFAVDLPGHGLSAHRPAHAPYHFVDGVADLAQIIGALGLVRPLLIGHSMGAGIASLYAGTFPDEVAGIVLLEGLGPLSDPPEAGPARLARALVAERASRRPARGYPELEAAIDRVLEVAPMERASARPLVERGLRREDGGWVWRADPRLRAPSRLRMTEPQVLAFLGRIRAPALLVVADRGYGVAVEPMQGRIAALADLEVVRLAGRHHVHLDDPHAVAEAILAWLPKVAR